MKLNNVVVNCALAGATLGLLVSGAAFAADSTGNTASAPITENARHENRESPAKEAAEQERRAQLGQGQDSSTKEVDEQEDEEKEGLNDHDDEAGEHR